MPDQSYRYHVNSDLLQLQLASDSYSVYPLRVYAFFRALQPSLLAFFCALLSLIVEPSDCLTHALDGKCWELVAFALLAQQVPLGLH